MPSIRRYAPRPPVQAAPYRAPRRRDIRARRASRAFRYKRGTKIGASSRGKKGVQNVTQLTTLSRKTENLSISFREEFDFTSMGHNAGSSPMLLRVRLNNPVAGGPTPTSADAINTVISNLKNGSSDPLFTRSSYNMQQNLSDRLEDYFEEYRTCVVTSSEVTFNVRPKINQTSGIGFVNTRSVVPYLSLVTTGQHPDGFDGKPIGPSEVLKVTAPNATGELYVWSVRQSAQQQLHNLTDGTPPLETLKMGIPGVRMTKLNVTPNSKSGVTFKLKYTPNSQFQIKDWKDKKEVLSVLNQASNPNLKEAYAYLGIGGRINGRDPAPPGDQADISSAYLANCVVEVSVKYNLNFSERKNVDGNNEPVPHRDEL